MASNLQTYGYGKKKQTAIIKPSALAAQKKQYGFTDGGGKTQATVSNAVTSTDPTPRQPAVQRPAVIKPSVQAAQEKQYGIVDWKDIQPQTNAKTEVTPGVRGGFGKNDFANLPEANLSEKQNWAKTVLDVADRGAGYGVQGISTAIDVAANALPIVEGWVFGVGCKIFTIAGPVILYGIFSSWILGIIYWVCVRR